MSRGTDWAMITGAGSGIGAALAQALTACEVGIVLVGRRPGSTVRTRTWSSPSDAIRACA